MYSTVKTSVKNHSSAASVRPQRACSVSKLSTMFALGCLQAQTCHTGHCPTGVTTQDPQRQKALDVGNKADRVYHFHEHTLMALKELVQAAGLRDPADITADHIVRRNSEHGVKLLANLLPFVKTGELLDGESDLQVFRVYWPMASAHSFAATPTSP